MNLHELGEFGLIRHLSNQLGIRSGVDTAIGDDAAILESLHSPLVTCDALVEEIHFRRDWTTPRALGRKSLSVNVSDIAAMGGTPIAAFVTLALSKDTEVLWLEELYAGMEEIAADFGFTIAGGDTTRSNGPICLSITLVGNVPENQTPWLRSGAQIGDVVFVTGTLGDSAAGLALLQDEQNRAQKLDRETREYLLCRHFDPTARLREAQVIQRFAAQFKQTPIHAALDLSDGIAGDSAHVARASGFTLEIDAARLPLSSHAKAAAQLLHTDALPWALRGGEDYELLLCVAPEAADAFDDVIERHASTHKTSTRMTRVGRVVAAESSPVKIIGPDGKFSTEAGAFEHF
jgi:thiamine-monophosphate kinase